MQGEQEEILQVEHLCKKLKHFRVRDVSFSLKPGYIMGLIGRNGAGKTTIMNLILNRYIKSSGRVTIAGYDNQKQESKAKDEIGFVLDKSPFFLQASIEENARLFGPYYTRFSMEIFREYIEKFRLPLGKRIKDLSKGMETKFQLAFALAHRPSLLLLDEPTGGLDPVFRREFLSMLQEWIEKEKTAVLFSTHITSDLDKVADYVTMVEQGRIVLSESKEDLMDHYRIIKGNKEDLKKIRNEWFVSVRYKGNGFEAMTEHYKEIEKNYNETGVFLTERPTIEEIMYFISKGGDREC